jgi:thioredoxin-dependent peroxiredoxin
MPLQEGKAAPSFSLPSTEGKEISLSDFKGKKNVVLYFYPKDNTPGCTQESCDFRDMTKLFAKKDAVILGISADSIKSHEGFRDKFSLSFPLLSDETKETIKKYDVWKEKSLYGKTYMGIERTTVVIDKEGKVRKIFPKVKVTGHAEEVLSSI